VSDWTPRAAALGCWTCKHFDPARLACAAYPKGIPLPIASGQVDHTVERPDQAPGILFEKVES